MHTSVQLPQRIIPPVVKQKIYYIRRPECPRLQSLLLSCEDLAGTLGPLCNREKEIPETNTNSQMTAFHQAFGPDAV